MQWNRILVTATILSFGLLSLLLIFLSQEPLCIDSKIVERIDRLSLSPSSKGPESVYRCSVRRSVPYSSYFAEKLPSWVSRIKRTEKFLESIEPFYRRVQISIVPQQDFFFQVHNHHIRIGERLLETPGHLERALIKVWFRERNTNQFSTLSLTEEVIVDFLLFAHDGNLNLEDHRKISLEWWTPLPTGPFLLQSQGSYCESPWRKSEHYLACDSITFDISQVSSTMADLSLRPLLTQIWIESYLELKGAQRYRFIQDFESIVRSYRSDLAPHTIGAQDSSDMKGMILHLKESQKYVSTVSLLRDRDYILNFQKSFQRNLHKLGFYDSAIEAQVDFILTSLKPLNADSKVLIELEEYTKRNKEAQVAVRDPKNIWILPSRYPLSVESFSQLKSKRMALQVCGSYDFNFVLSLAEQTEKLLVLNNCEEKTEIQYSLYIEKGIEAFSARYPDLAFVQYHLPSLAMKAAELKNIKNVYDLIQPNWNQKSVLQSLGWQKVLWNEDARAFQPQAVIEGIEWFRPMTAVSNL